MWTRAEIKSYAKGFLKKHYWKAFIVCLIVTLLTGQYFNSANNSNIRYEYNIDYNQNIFPDKIPITFNNDGVNFVLNKMGFFPIAFIGMGIFFLILILWIVLSVIIGPLLKVGSARFFLNGFREDVDIKYLFSTFNNQELWPIFKAMFITGLYNFLWTLLLIIPGIVKAYEYRFVPYILAKEPNLTATEAIARSRELTSGEKMNMFVLDLSFIGWNLLGMLFFGIGGIFVAPYVEATYAKLYNVLSDDDYYDDGYDSDDEPQIIIE